MIATEIVEVAEDEGIDGSNAEALGTRSNAIIEFQWNQ